MKRTLFIVTIVSVLLLSSLAVFADSYQSILSGITGISEEQINELRSQGVGYGQIIPASIISRRTNTDIKDVIELRKSSKTYYQIAQDKNIEIEDFKNDMLADKLAIVDERVKTGTLTEEQASALKDKLKTAIESCDGQGNGAKAGMFGGMGRMNDSGNGARNGVKGNGFGNGNGRNARGGNNDACINIVE